MLCAFKLYEILVHLATARGAANVSPVSRPQLATSALVGVMHSWATSPALVAHDSSRNRQLSQGSRYDSHHAPFPGGVLPMWWVIHMCRGFDPLFSLWQDRARSFLGIFLIHQQQSYLLGYKNYQFLQKSIFLAPNSIFSSIFLGLYQARIDPTMLNSASIFTEMSPALPEARKLFWQLSCQNPGPGIMTTNWQIYAILYHLCS